MILHDIISKSNKHIIYIYIYIYIQTIFISCFSNLLKWIEILQRKEIYRKCQSTGSAQKCIHNPSISHDFLEKYLLIHKKIYCNPKMQVSFLIAHKSFMGLKSARI